MHGAFMINFKEIVIQCYNNSEFTKEYNRITGSDIHSEKSPIYLIDKSTGREDEELLKFISFVDEYVWKPLMTC